MHIMTPEGLSGIHVVDFRAPPPSPVASGRLSSLANDEVLTEYLHHSLKVPDLVLPDRVFPREKSNQSPPKIDFHNLDSLENDSTSEISRIAQVGCVEVTNHGISRDLIKLVLFLVGGVFEISREKKRTVTRSPERRYGFEEINHGEEEGNGDQSEEFVWCGDEMMRLEMEGVWPIGYSNFSEKMEKLSRQIEEIAEKMFFFLQHHSLKKLCPGDNLQAGQELAGKLCYIQKHSRKMDIEQSENSLRYDVIRMLIRGSEFGHALCLHLCSGSTDFHVYSKKGWVSFCPSEDSIVITLGDKLQMWSGGQYKHVIGRPVFRCEDEKCISMGFLYSPSNMITNSIKDDDKDVTISLSQQIILGVLLTIVFQVLVHIYKFLYK